ncbi:hypothetical protein [Alkalihalobacillus pseudalcaliphilus]|uniref:hypothetical protein n=1 Tax=Alkalihalobacillus pseudalcaliphilus TaxID=79884 RepID=UPI00064D7BD4|nr:hypothetical protein [Alkalihalobacillus pseudalcaliphilus]KMK78155.1 hypothetical protein AB990_01580 [Alkalihalobacillus pseudalcaliphilus]
MYQPTERIQELLNACEQIISHMEVSDSHQVLFEKIKQQLINSRQQFQFETHDSHTFMQLQLTMYELSSHLEKLQESVLNDYQVYTNDSIDDYEALSYKEQIDAPSIYHAKIDYYSTTKLLSNLDKINSELKQII